MNSRKKTIDRAEEAFKMGVIEGLEYDASECIIPGHPALHGNIYAPEAAKALVFGTDCRCDLLPYNSRWRDKLPAYSEPLWAQKARIKREYEQYFFNNNLASLVKLEKLYAQDLQWHWAELQRYADNFRRQGDYERALTWINVAINARMTKMRELDADPEYDPSLASLYTARGNIFIEEKNYEAALRVFVIAIMQYKWKPTKTLAQKIKVVIKKADISEQAFSSVIKTTKTNGLNAGLSELENILSTCKEDQRQ